MSSGKLTVAVDDSKCMSHQLCIAAVPEAFALGPQHTAVVLPGAENVPLERLLDAARMCPMAAISITDESGNEVRIH